MTVRELADLTKSKIVTSQAYEERELSGCYIGDLLSLAMSKVEKDNIWITIQTNINIAAVASLTEAGCILICEGFLPDENTKTKAEEEGIVILSSEKGAYELAGEIVVATK